MAREFTFKDLNNLIKEFNSLLIKLECANKYSKSYKQSIIREVDFLANSNYFKKFTSKDIKNNVVNGIDANDIINVLKSLYCYEKSKAYVDKCNDLYINNADDIKGYFKSLSLGNNILKWTFLNKERKTIIENDYRELKEELGNEFYIESKRIISALEQLKNTEKNVVINDYLQDEKKYYTLLFKVYNNYHSINNNVQEINDIIIKSSDIIENFNLIDNGINSCKERIKKAIDDMLAVELLNVARGIPLEELNRTRSGIRIKTLFDAGYKNMADIYTSTESQLASISGITYRAALTIKSIARNYMRQAQQDLKIKISIDNKNNKSSKVVEEISYYKNMLEIVKKRDDLLNKYINTVNENTNLLKEIVNGIKYVFSDKEKKQLYLNAYQLLQVIVNGDFGNDSKEIMSSYNSLRRVENQEAWNDFENNSISFFNIIEDIYPGILGNGDSFYGLPEKLARDIQDQAFFPDGLLCTLRKYQELGVKYILHQEKVLLGDEMGLGKTIQAIATMVSLKNTGATHFMVICPASVISNWCREISKHSKLKPTMIHGSMRKTALKSWIDTGGVAVTTYETTHHIELDYLRKISLIVVDEAHYIKNPNAKRTKNTILLCKRAERLLFMTGTALENRVDEMINLIEILNPSIASQIAHIAFMSSAPQFREKIAGVYYRRKREDVLTELPDLIESEEWCTMTKQEEMVYEESILYGSYAAARRLSWNVDDLKYSSKANRLKEIVEEAKDEGRKVLIFSFFLDTIRKIHELLGKNCSEPITGSVTPKKRQEIIDEFDTASAGSVLLAQIIAGGTGLNIQSASVVIICEPQFKPSIENQAISRAYRMGQARNVLVYRLLCENTIDERIIDLLEEKQKIFNAFADKSVAAENSKNIEIDDKAFGDIIKEEIERINKKRGIEQNNKIVESDSIN